MSRSDVLRGQSWEVATADDNSRSTRGGQVGSGYARRREKADARCAAGACACRAYVPLACFSRHAAVALTRSVALCTDGAWTSCSLSGEPLRETEVVACARGRLYNRQAVLEHLLAMRGAFPEERVAYQVRKGRAELPLNDLTQLYLWL